MDVRRCVGRAGGGLAARAGGGNRAQRPADSARSRSRRRRALGGAALRVASLALLRALRHRGHALARAGQLPGISRSRSSRRARRRRTSDCNCSPRRRRAIWDSSRVERWSSVWSARSTRSTGCRACRDISSIGIRSRICACSIRRTCRRWIPGISPAISSRSPRDAPASPARRWMTDAFGRRSKRKAWRHGESGGAVGG